MCSRVTHASVLLAALAAVGCGSGTTAEQKVRVGARGAGSGDGGTLDQDAAAPRPSARPNGPAVLPPADDVVSLAYLGEPVLRSIEIDAEPSTLDVHLSIDTTGSIAGEIDALQRDLEEVLVPALRARVRDVAFGVSRFEDFPAPPFGSAAIGPYPADSPFRLVTAVTTELALVAAAVATLDQPLGDGGDSEEAGGEALYQVATGEGFTHAGQVIVEPFSGEPAPGGGIAGGVGFREGALRAVVHVTDTPSHAASDYRNAFPDAHDLDDAVAALAELGARVLGVVSTPCKPGATCEAVAYLRARAELERVATETRAVAASEDGKTCPHGVDGTEVTAVEETCPLVFDVASDGEGLSEALIEAIVGLLDGVRFEAVSAQISDDPIGFVQRVVPVDARQSPGAEQPEQADLLPEPEPDGQLDSFVQVRSKARLAFDIVLQNTKIASSDVEQRFRVVVKVFGDDLLLEERTLRIVVPAGRSLAPRSDAAVAPAVPPGAAEGVDGG